MGNDSVSVADVLALTNRGYGENCNTGGFGFGNDGGWWIIILIILFAGGGWGRGGFGFGGGTEGGPIFGMNPCCTPATAQGVTDAFNFNQIDNSLRGLEQGLCDGFYSMNNSNNCDKSI